MSQDIEFRKDYLFDRWSIINHNRKLRPFDNKVVPIKQGKKICFFCPGNEEEETRIGQLPKKGAWKVRWIWNKYPALSPQMEGKPSNSKMLRNLPGFGYHQLVIETPVHDQGFHELSIKQILLVFEAYKQRFNQLSKKKGVKYVVLFKNHGLKAGASLTHEHSQVIAQSRIPTYVKQKLNLIKGKPCPYCKILKDEVKSKRKVYSDDYFAAFSPYAPRFSNEVWLMPKRHVTHFNQLNSRELLSMAKLLKRLIRKALKLSDSFNYIFFNSPNEKNNLHFHVELFPRSSIWAGYEFETGDQIISVAPEESARFYRDG